MLRLPRIAAPGACGQESGKPILRDIRPDDLRRLSRLRELFRQATEAGWLSRSEADFQNFVAAAVRATRLEAGSVRNDPVRVFVGIVRKRLWHHITIEQEERAREVIARARSKVSAPSTNADRAAVHRLFEQVLGRFSDGGREAGPGSENCRQTLRALPC